MYCYAVNRKCSSPAHLWLTGCKGDMESQLQRLPGFDKWIIEKENRSYIEALEDHKENLVYLTADSDTVLDDLDPNKIYIVGGLVDRNRWKGITMKKAQEQGIQTGRLPIGNYLKMSSSQVTFGLGSFIASIWFWLMKTTDLIDHLTRLNDRKAHITLTQVAYLFFFLFIYIMGITFMASLDCMRFDCENK